MKRLILGTVLLALAMALPVPTMAMGGRVDVGVSVPIPLPPPIMFPAPPTLVVIPETYVYAVPEVDEDIFFYGGWWWRPWDGRWYRSQRYDSGWSHYQGMPSFHRSVPSSWRNDYRQRRWKGHQWDQRRVPHQQVQKNWQGWERDRHWEKQNHWGVRGMQSPPKPSKQPSGRVQSKQPPPPSRDTQRRQQQDRGDRGRDDDRGRDRDNDRDKDRRGR